MVYLLGYMAKATLSVLLSSVKTRWRHLLGFLAAILLVSFLLAVCSNRSFSLAGWVNFFASLLLATFLFWIGWQLVREESPPAWLARLTLAAVLLRLALGALWFVLLPTVGYGTLAERNGYIMADAYNRDRTAWRVGHSDIPLSNILTVRSFRKVDQYGGLLLLSSAYYRFFDGQSHHPLMMIVLTAICSSLAVLFTWALTRRAFGMHAANISAWGIALYPEAVLLGSSQMREAFLIPLICLSFYGLIRLLSDHSWKSAFLTFSALVLTWPFSPPATGLLLTSLVLVGLMGGELTLFRQKRLWIGVGLIAILVLLGIWVAWSNYAPQGKHNILSIAAWWFKISAGMQARLSILDSGWIQKILASLPSWLHFPLLTLYGVLRPFLPAALIDASGKPFWQVIAIWRALGWTVLLAFLMVAPLIAFRKVSANQLPQQRLARAFSLVIWAGILIASMRAGADLWDNPRYRAMFSGVQIALAAWVWIQHKEHGNPWLKHITISLGLVLVWFIPWYLRRYFSFPWFLPEFFPTLIAGVLSVMAYGVYQFTRQRSP